MAIQKTYTIQDDETLVCFVAKTEDLPEMIEAFQKAYPEKWDQEIMNDQEELVRKYPLTQKGAETFAKDMVANYAKEMVKALRGKKAQEAAAEAAAAADTEVIINTDITAQS